MLGMLLSQKDNIFSYDEGVEATAPLEFTSASCFLTMLGDGSINIGTADDIGGSVVLVDDFWIKPNDFNYVDNYEIFATLTGDVAGPAGTWSSFAESTSFFYWSLTAFNPEDLTGKAIVQIRRKGDTTVLGTVDVDMRVRP